MNQYNYPTIILSGIGALDEFINRLAGKSHRRVLIVTDETLAACGLVDQVTDRLAGKGILFSIFSGVHPNPVQGDVAAGAEVFKRESCDSIIAFGGGSPMDAAKAVKIMAVHKGPFAQYDDARGGDRLITKQMPPLYAIPTTAGTGSEVGRSAVIIVEQTGKKAIFFHPLLMPDMAVLEPELTMGLPPHITAATGIDAFVHNLEAYLAPGFHPMSDGIALQGMELIIEALPAAVADGADLQAREHMLIAASMGAIAFQKGLGMIHSLAHPLSSRHHMHHGLANALLLAGGIGFLEDCDLNQDQMNRLAKVRSLFDAGKYPEKRLSDNLRLFVKGVGIKPGLSGQGIRQEDLDALSAEAFEDPCHPTNMVAVNQADLLSVYRAAL
ncbi:MAG: iron-containing alcohol dehydrogenase [Deltaproteobacteria bacterium]|nr:iron-containing alcohol dehydrogenase [Deltaproteobacteria bacterium]